MENIVGHRNFVGVVPPITFKTLGYPKQLLLMFDKIAVDLTNNLTDYEHKIITSARPEIDWLSSAGMLTTLSGMIASENPEINKNEVQIKNDFLLPRRLAIDLNKFAKTSLQAYNGMNDMRVIAAKLRELKNIDAVAVGSADTPIILDRKADRDDVIKITLGQFPIPSDITPWENIVSFKKEERTTEQFYRLKNWINKTGREGLRSYEVIDELKGLLMNYEQGMKHYEMEANLGVLEVIVKTTADIAEGIARFKFSKVVEPFFRATHKRTKLLEEERKVEGKEVAYIVNAIKTFRK